MKITLIDTTVSPPARLVIADHTTKRILAGISVRPERSIELLAGTRWDEAIPVDRANAHVTLTFSVDYSMPTTLDAEIEFLELADRTPGSARVEIEAATATQRKTRYLDPATIQITGISYHGIAVSVSYQITGGILRTA